MSRRTVFRCLLLASALVACTRPAAAADSAAEVVSLRGSARAFSEQGVSRPLRTGAGLFAGERVQTGARSALAMRFTDGSRFELGANASMRVDAYAYGDRTRRDGIATRIFKGVFRFVSGLIAKRRARAMSVRLPVVTIGIRGTNVAGEADATSATVILLEPEEGEDSAIEVFNEFGRVTIDQPGFGTEIPDQFSPPSPPRRMRAQAVQNLIRNIQSLGRIGAPRLR